jgi:outer membrane protein, heavy metal efflux system
MPEHRPARGAPAPTISGSSLACLLSALLIAVPLPAFADDTAPKKTATALNVTSFITRFETTNPRLEAIDAEVDARRADVTGASLWPNPALSYERERVFPDGGSVAENTLTLGWSLDISGRRSRRTDAARDQVRAAHARADDDKLTVLIQALVAFYDTAHARLRVEALREGREPLARMVDAVRARVKAGDAAGYDLSRLELELAAYEERIAEAETELRAARRTLGGLLGDPSALYDADDPLALPVVPAPDDELARDALATRGDYRATALDASSAAAALSAAKRGWVPLFDLGVGLKTADLGTETATGYIVMIGVELPLFSRGQADAERARAHRRAAQARRAQLEREIPTHVRIAYDGLAAAVERARTFRTEQLDRARALVVKAEAVYQAGEASIVELLDAYRTSVDARLRSLVLLRRAKAAELALSSALGRRPEAL